MKELFSFRREYTFLYVIKFFRCKKVQLFQHIFFRETTKTNGNQFLDWFLSLNKATYLSISRQ
jgi:hypothetical protein